MINIFTISIFFLLTITNVLSEYSSQDCRSLGFNKVNLMCSTCKKCLEYDLKDIHDHCIECCVKEEDTSTKRYAKAELEVCTCKFATYPQIQAFIKSDRPSKYKNLEIKYMRGKDPVIKLYNKGNVLEDELHIAAWNTDSVDEFFDTRLLK